ncbi:unnamed protein product, partial [Discosporangium mesarthrocarpum]
MPPRAHASARRNVQEYFFTIGSVDSFERKLESAQRELGIKPKDFIPVQYVSETDWQAAVARMLPTLIVAGAVFYFLRSAGG